MALDNRWVVGKRGELRKEKIEKYYGEGGWEEKKEEVAEVDLLKYRLKLEDWEELRLDLWKNLKEEGEGKEGG